MWKKSRYGVIKRGYIYLYVDERLIFEKAFSSSKICKDIMTSATKRYKLKDKGLSYFEVRIKRKTNPMKNKPVEQG